MHDTNALLLAASLLLFTSILLSNVTARLGVPLLLLFLAVGMLAGEDGPGGIRFSDFDIAYLVGNLALAVILLDGGLRTRARTFRVAMGPALSLATIGVVLTAGLLGIFATWLLDVDWRYGLLLGAIVGSTDAAAVFSLMRQGGVRVNERVGATLEIESGANDPMAIFLVLVIIEWITAGGGRGPALLLVELLTQFGVGAVAGLAGGWVLSALLARVRLVEGLYPLLVVSGGLLLFAAVNTVGGSGFLAVYLAGLVVGNRPNHATGQVLSVMDGLAWLSQAGMFLVLGLLVTPSAMLRDLGAAVAIAAFLVFVARPLAVLVGLLPFRMPLREQAFVAWVGLRGAVPIVLALFPVMAGLKNSSLLFNVTFVVVLGSLLVQGMTVPWVARLLRVQLPTREREPERHLLPVPMQPVPELLMMPVDGDVPCVGRKVVAVFDDLSPAGKSACSAIVREGQLLFPREDDRLLAGDIAILLVQHEDEARVVRAFTPVAAEERRSAQRFFGEFVLDAQARVGDVAAAYGLSIADADAQATLADMLQRRLGSRVVVGDRLKLDAVTLTVREIEGGVIRRVGLKLSRQAPDGT